MDKNCIGLFGTCGKSKWRDEFVKKYEELGITFFNPNVPDWKPELAVIEAEHLANDQILLFPITNETYATGSLAESGFSILNAIKLDDRRDLVMLIHQDLEQELKDENPTMAKESLRARALVTQHLKKQNLANLYVVSTIEEMLQVSVTLWESHQIRNKIKDFSIKK